MAVARSLVTEPTIMLLDEPLSNLDAKLRDQMRIELLDIQERTGITFVYVTHDQAEAMSMSTRIAVMRTGRLVQVAAPRDVYFEPADADVADFMGLINFLPGAVLASPARGSAKVRLDGGGEVAGRDFTNGATVGTRVLAAIRPEAVSLGSPGRTGPVGSVKRLVMLGNLTHAFIEIPGIEAHVRVQVPNTTALEHGETVTLVLDPARVSVFSAPVATVGGAS